MQFFFADDARRDKPSRKGMGPLVAIGGVVVPVDQVGGLEKVIRDLCGSFGFPPGEPFKWSPGPELWMRDNLILEKREKFFVQALSLTEKHGAKASVVIEDTNRRPAMSDKSPEEDVVCMFLERVDNKFRLSGEEGIVVVDRPSGGRVDENKFLQNCSETILSGTQYVRPEHIALNVLSSPAAHVRLLQVADVVTSCTLSFASGENKYSPPVFEAIKRLLLRDLFGRVGGIGLKIHPDLRYANLYHWLVGDGYIRKGNVEIPLPIKRFPYSADPDIP